MARRPRFFDYYRQFDALDPEEDRRLLRAKRAEERARELAIVPPLSLDHDEWHEPPDAEIINAATFALRKAINRYPDPRATEAREGLAAYHGVDAAQIALGHGAGQLLQAALRAAAVGGEVVLPWPGWRPLPALAARTGAQPVAVPLGADAAVDLDAVHAAVTGDTRAVVLATPNDPTGLLVERDDVARLAAALPERLTLLVDEALIDFVGEDASCVPLVSEPPGGATILVFRSFSKAWAMAGFRAGYVLGPARAADALAELSPGQGVASPAQAAVVAALEYGEKSMRRRRSAIAAERKRFAQVVEGTSFEYAPTRTHHVWLRSPNVDGRRLARALEERRISVAAGGDWGDDDHVRLTLRDKPATERVGSALRALS